jgi:hypothetical protein
VVRDEDERLARRNVTRPADLYAAKEEPERDAQDEMDDATRPAPLLPQRHVAETEYVSVAHAWIIALLNGAGKKTHGRNLTRQKRTPVEDVLTAPSTGLFNLPMRRAARTRKLLFAL